MAASQFTQPCADTARAQAPASERATDQFTPDATDRLSAKLLQAQAIAGALQTQFTGEYHQAMRASPEAVSLSLSLVHRLLRQCESAALTIPNTAGELRCLLASARGTVELMDTAVAADSLQEPGAFLFADQVMAHYLWAIEDAIGDALQMLRQEVLQ